MQNNKIKILIVDDIEDNRLIIKKICRKLENVELLEAANGQEAIDVTRENEPHIVLMDIMMPVMDGFEASTIIKSEFPNVHIIVVTALTDDVTEQNFLKLGVDGYLKKPLARGVLKVKLEGLIAALHIKDGTSNILSVKNTLNPFNKNIRKMKTIFDVENEDEMMNLGLWLTSYYTNRNAVTTMNFDFSLDLIYQFIKNQIKRGVSTKVILEEDFDDVYLSFVTSNELTMETLDVSIEDRIRENIVVKNGMFYLKIKMKYDYQPEALMAEEMMKGMLASMSDLEAGFDGASEYNFSSVDSGVYDEKISAKDFACSLDSGTIKSIDSLGAIEKRFGILLDELEDAPSAVVLKKIVDDVVVPYAAVINKIFEFNIIGYAISTMSVFLRSVSDEHLANNTVRMHSILLSILQDLTSWRRDVFIDCSASDIHQYDSAILYLCIQIDSEIKLAQDGND